MSVVLDTNVIVSALLTTDGVCSQILEMIAADKLLMCMDDGILAEYEDILRRPSLGIKPENTAPFLEMVYDSAESVVALPIEVALPDPKDRPFLEVAAAANAVLVTGNTRHYPVNSRAGVTVLTPMEFLDLVRRSP